MLQTPEPLTAIAGHIDGDWAVRDAWSPMKFAPENPDLRELRFLLGDQESGPAVYLSHGRPREAPKNYDPSKTPPHLHRTPTFRISLGDQPEQMQINRSWFGDGDYFLMDANKFYLDPNGNDGFAILNVFADRRGVFPCFRLAPGKTSEEMDAFARMLISPLDELFHSHGSNEAAIKGGAISTKDRLDPGGQARGSIHDQSDWTALSDGSRVAVAAIGDEVSGPIILMTGNASGAVESPSARHGADSLRMIARGACGVGETDYRAGRFIASEAGSACAPVVHGPDGSTQLLVISDRRRWRPVDDTGAPIASDRLDQIEAVIARVCPGAGIALAASAA